MSKEKYCYIKTLDGQLVSRAMSAKGKQWAVGDTIDIAWIGGSQSERKFVQKHSEEWLKHANIKFRWSVPLDQSDVRIAFNKRDGSWSYVGTDAMFVRENQPTMNFGWLDKATVLHEFGHLLGLKHEHQNPKSGIKWNKQAVIDSLSKPPNNWSLSEIYHNVLNQAKLSQVKATTFDPKSIMMYFFPAKWTKNGRGFTQNTRLSERDKEFISKLYPFTERVSDSNGSNLQFKRNWFRKILGRIRSFFSR